MLTPRRRNGGGSTTRAQALYESAAEMGANPFARDRLAERYGLAWYARGKRATKEAAAGPKTAPEKKAPKKKGAPQE